MAKQRPDYNIFDLATYLVASARDLMDEPLIYSPLRMLVAVNRIVQMGEEDPYLRDEFLVKMNSKISNDVLSVMSDREMFKEALDELLLEFAGELKRRTMKGPPGRGGRRLGARRRTS